MLAKSRKIGNFYVVALKGLAESYHVVRGIIAQNAYRSAPITQIKDSEIEAKLFLNS